MLRKYLALSSVILFLGISLDIFAQQKALSVERPWNELMQDHNVNFYDVQRAFNEHWKDREITKGQGYKQYKRWENFMEPRVYPSGERFAPDAVYNAVKDQKGKSAMLKSMLGEWTYFGNTSVPSNGGGVGRVNSVRSTAAAPSTYYACAPAGGLWKSTNSGGSWTVMNTDQLTSIGASDVAIDPTNPNILYLATGDGDAGDTYSIGILKSTDGGATWNTTGLSWTVTQTVRTSRILIHPSNPNILIVAASNGIYKSTNAGATWTNVQAGNFKDLKFKPNNPSTVYATGSGAYFYKSTNTGDSFSQIGNGLPNSGVNRMAMGVSPNDVNVVYILAGSSSTSGFYGLYRSNDSGANWTLQSNSPNILGWSETGAGSGGQSWYDLSCAVDPNDVNTVYTGGVNVWKSSNGGVTWTCVGHWYGAAGIPYVHADIHALEFIPGTSTLLVGSDGGVFRTTNAGSTFSDRSSNLEIGQMYRLGLAQTNENRVITGWQDNGSNIRNAANNWNFVIGGDGMECIISHSNQDVMYGTIYFGQIFKSTNAGANFSTIVGSGGAGVNEGGAWVTPYIMDPSNSNNLWLGKSTVYKSTDAGSTWTTLGAIPGGSMNALAVAPSNSDYIYCSKGASLYRTTDGNTFTAITGLPNLYLTYIAIDPSDPLHLWVTFSGFSAGEKVYESTNGGNSWTNYSTGLPNISANCIVYQNGSDDGLYIGTDAGVYYRESAFASWQPYMEALPNVPVSELEIHYSSGRIVAATYGRGIWRAPLFSLPALDAAVLEIIQPEGTICASLIEPQISISNFGINTITSLDFEYSVAGGPLNNFSWNGSLATADVQLVSFPAFDEGAGNFDLTVNIISINGAPADDNDLNNDKVKSYFVTGGTNDVALNINTDCWGNESSYAIVDEFGNTIYTGAGLPNLSAIQVDMCLADGCYTLNFNDSYGDGMAGTLYGCGTDGNYELLNDQGFPIVSMLQANFGFGESQGFCLPFVVVYGCMDPLADNYNPDAVQDDGSCSYSNCQDMQLSLSTDCWGGEVSWQIIDEFNNVLYEQLSNSLGSLQTFTYNYCIPEGCYTFIINDTYGDGMAGADLWGCASNGNYTITDAYGNDVVQMTVANYGFGTSHAFCLSPVVTPGCIFINACNFDPNASLDDGSCVFPGCIDAGACNYDAAAGCDDGSCIYPGCNDVNACSYDIAAGCDDGSCVFPGCTDVNACNYDIAAGCYDGSCIYPGCTDVNACNYAIAAGCDDGLCVFPGCNDVNACNYDIAAGCDDGLCIYSGCTDVNACNYDIAAGCDDGLCVFPGCTDNNACNYNAAAGCDDGSCEYPQMYYPDFDNDGYGDPTMVVMYCSPPPAAYILIDGDCDDNNNLVYPGATGTQEGIDNNCDGIIDANEVFPCFADLNNNGVVDIADLLILLGDFGCSANCIADLNNDGIVNAADMLAFLPWFGVECD